MNKDSKILKGILIILKGILIILFTVLLAYIGIQASEWSSLSGISPY